MMLEKDEVKTVWLPEFLSDYLSFLSVKYKV